MTATVLTAEDFNHQRLLIQWQDAADRYNRWLAWRQDNPVPDFGSPDSQDWLDQQRIFRESIGLPDSFLDPGQIKGQRGAFTLKLTRLVRDDDDQPLHGDRITQCLQCLSLFATFNRHDRFCTDSCRDAAVAAMTARRAERRRQRQQQRSAALANRTGICLACGVDFTLKRITAKTCSEACRKRLQRRPELAQEHLHLPPVRPDLADLEQDLEQAIRRNLAGFATAVAAGVRPEDTDKQQRVELKRTIWQQRCNQRLHDIADQAPALTAWLCQQQPETQLAAFDPRYSRVVLGPDLCRRLGLDFYTDAAVSWEVKYAPATPT